MRARYPTQFTTTARPPALLMVLTPARAIASAEEACLNVSIINDYELIQAQYIKPKSKKQARPPEYELKHKALSPLLGAASARLGSSSLEQQDATIG